MIKQQLDLSKTFDKSVPRIALLIRAADLLWPHQQDKARAAFTEAFELAIENEKENAANGPRSIILRMQTPDQRYLVIRAVSRKDSAWAKDLTHQMLKSANDGEPSSTRSLFENELSGTRLLDSANKMIATDISAALDLARMSLNYPASFLLTHFLYRVAEVNQKAADQFYAQALAAYADKPMRQFLYLQAYPFAWRDTLNTPVFSNHEVPANFTVNQSLQRGFVQILLRRAQQAVEVQPDEDDIFQRPDATRMSGATHLLQGLIRLEPQVSDSLPDLLPQLVEARERILVSLSVETQKLLLEPGREISKAPTLSFDERIEAAQKEPDVHERDEMIATAVLGAGSGKTNLAAIVQAIEKVSDSSLRGYLLEWIYFQRATSAIQEKNFEEAERLTSKIPGMEQRAYLHVEIAGGLLNRSETRTPGREILDEAITEARKAGVTIFAARTLLTASILYAKIDLSRSISVLTDAITCINRIENPDFISDDQAIENKAKRGSRRGEYRGEYVFRFYMPGFDPENAFREFAKIEFDTALSQVTTLTDKFQRATSTLSVADVCLQQVQRPKEKTKKNARP
jgi:hypothetical protein